MHQSAKWGYSIPLEDRPVPSRPGCARLAPRWYPLLLTALILGACSNSQDPQGPERDSVPTTTTAAALATFTAQSADAFVETIGLNTRLTNVGTVYGRFTDIIKPRLAELGVRHLRDGGHTKINDGWMNTVYGRMRELGALGIKFDLVMFPAEGAPDSSSIYQWDRFLSYAGPVAENFEGLNEWDLRGRSPEWATKVAGYQQALWARVKNDPRIAGRPLFGPSMGLSPNARYVANLSAWLNYGNLHAYPGGNPPSRFLAYNTEWMQPMSPGRRFVVTETGYHNALQWTLDHPAVSEYAASHYVGRLFLEYFAAGYPRTYLQELIDAGPDNLTNRESSFGLLRNDGTPKPAYTALKNMITLLKDKGPGFVPGSLSYTLSGDQTNLKTLLLQKRNGTFYLAMWQAGPAYDLATKKDIVQALRGVTITFPAPVTQTQQFTPLTSTAPFARKTNPTAIFVGVPDHPIFVEIVK